ncbi:shikimate kinase [Bdellovibrionota bacterium FG-1]
MKEAAVIGFPLSHSLSPAIFSFLAQRLGVRDFRYKAREVSPFQLQSVLAEYRRTSGFIGLNVTIPYKQAILTELDAVTSEAKAIGAVNVVHADENRLFGYNTDLPGVLRTLADPSFRGCPVAESAVWIFGAGGAARAVAYAMGKLGAKTVYIFNRNSENAEILAKNMGEIFPKTLFGVVPEDRLSSVEPLALVVNATSVGMKTPAPQSAEPFFEVLRRLPFRAKALAFDLIYNPEKTPFLTLAEELGLATVGGLNMLVEQALATWKIWFGSRDGLAEIKAPLLLHLRGLLSGWGIPQGQPIFLTGFMGSGKSSIGAILARKLGWEFVDTDHLIESEAGLSIPKIFQTYGEGFFRELERKIIFQVGGRLKTVIALGGGALMNPEALDIIEKSGLLIYLSATVETLHERVRPRAANRPLFAGLDAEGQAKKIQALLEARTPIYNRARIQVETDRKAHEEVVEMIMEQLLWEKP